MMQHCNKEIPTTRYLTKIPRLEGSAELFDLGFTPFKVCEKAICSVYLEDLKTPPRMGHEDAMVRLLEL
jgi:hypothetical protein